MPNYEIQTTLNMVSNVPADFVQNVWSVIADSDADVADAGVAIRAWYTANIGKLSNLVASTNHRMKFFRRADPIPRQPFEDFTWNLVGSMGTTPLPPEVAICTSFQGAPTSGVNQARRRGRIYLGPLAQTTMGTDGRVSSATVTQLVAAAQTLLTASDTALNWSWSVYSPTSGGGVIVDNGWIDNEFDTQRRRGRKPTTRTTFT